MEDIDRINDEINRNGTAFSTSMLTDQEKFFGRVQKP